MDNKTQILATPNWLDADWLAPDGLAPDGLAPDWVTGGWAEALGYAALAFGLATYSMRRMLWLRSFALGSNLSSLLYGLAAGLLPLVVLHALLLPINLWRLSQVIRQRRAVTKGLVVENPNSVLVNWLRPRMRPQKLASGDQLFVKGEPGDTLYFLLSGTLFLPELDLILEPETFFGEGAYFAHGAQRAYTIQATSDCRLLALPYAEVTEALYANPEFGVFLTKLATKRLAENARRQQRTVLSTTAPKVSAA